MSHDLLVKLKLYCKVDFNDDDLLLELLYGAAVKYLRKANIEEDPDDEEYLVLAFAIVLEWYDQGSMGTVSVGVRELINQFKHDNIVIGCM